VLSYCHLVTSKAILHLSLPVDDLVAARDFYERAMGCRIGRERDDWFDAWFHGLQLTLQLRPDEVLPVARQGVRHFGVVLSSRHEFDSLVTRINTTGYKWISQPEIHGEAELSGKLGGKLADPSGNIIEIKFYEDQSDFLG
jgi:extradiol dioxygenase family protein